MKQPNTEKLRLTPVYIREGQQSCQLSLDQALMLSLKELMDVHGWPAHEAFVQQLSKMSSMTRRTGIGVKEEHATASHTAASPAIL